MIWVGDDAADSDYDVLEESPPSAPSSFSSQQGVWKPGKMNYSSSQHCITTFYNENPLTANQLLRLVNSFKDIHANCLCISLLRT